MAKRKKVSGDPGYVLDIGKGVYVYIDDCRDVGRGMIAKLCVFWHILLSVELVEIQV